MKRLYIILIILLVAAGIGATVGFRMYYKKNPDTKDLKANATVDVAKITSDFKTDSSKARKKYNNDVVALSGTVDKVEKDQQGHIYIDFVANDVKVQCLMQDNGKQDAVDIKEKDNVKLKCKFTGYMTDDIDPQPQLQFKDCVVMK